MTADRTDKHSSVLVVTGNQEFAAACKRHLSAVADLHISTAKTVEEATDTLVAKDEIDCIVSDHNLPDIDGVTFLEVVRAQSPTLPFILLTSDGSEAVASRAISANVTEYLIKDPQNDQWEQLATRIEAAVAYYHDQNEHVKTEARTRTLLDAADDMIAVARDGDFDYINKTGAELLGVEDQTTIIGKPVDEMLSLEMTPSLADRLNDIQQGGQSLDHAKTQLSRSDGTRLPVEVTITQHTWSETPAVVLVIRDISDRLERERNLTLKTRAMDEAPVGITIADVSQPDNPMIYVNEEFQQVTGYSEAEVLGRNCRLLQGDETDPEPVREMREAIDAEESVTVEVRNYRKDGTQFWNRVTIAPIDQNGAVTHYVGFQEDITEHKEYEQMLRQFRQAVEAAGHAIYMTDPDGTITYVNPAFERITGYESKAAVGRTPQILKSGEMSEDYYEELWTTLSAGDVWEEEICDKHHSGELYHAHQTIAPLTDDGEIDSYIAIQTDVTEQKEREAQLHQYERAIEGSNELIAAIDDEYRYLFANYAYQEFHDLDADSVTGMPLADGIGTETFERVKPYIEQVFAGQTFRYRTTRTRSEKPNRTFEIRYYPLKNDSNDVRAVVVTMHDITERIERENQLASLDRMLRHTLKNELNVILGSAELINEQASSDIAALATSIETAADQILSQADKEREIVEMLSNPSSPTMLSLGELTEQVAANVETEHPNAEITVDVPAIDLTTIPELERAVSELVENALEHTDQDRPEVTITADVTAEVIRLSISDNGPGIPLEERAVIAENAEIEPLLHSNGMGLWLVKRVVTRAGGTIKFTDAEPRGSVVTLILPK